MSVFVVDDTITKESILRKRSYLQFVENEDNIKFVQESSLTDAIDGPKVKKHCRGTNEATQTSNYRSSNATVLNHAKKNLPSKTNELIVGVQGIEYDIIKNTPLDDQFKIVGLKDTTEEWTNMSKSLEKLREENNELKNFIRNLETRMDAQENIINDLRGEVGKLKNIVKKVADHPVFQSFSELHNECKQLL
jgi:predicted RNase H-like nuclease (RuvC/YqgF family)